MNNALITTGTHFLSRPGTGRFYHITESEVCQLADAAKHEQTRLLIKTLWYTGARISEVLDIRASDFDYSKNTLIIRRRKRRKEFEQTLPIPGDLANSLRLFARSHGRRGKIFEANRISAFTTISTLSMEVLAKKISPKWFRHGRAYQLVSKGTHPFLAARALGHASVNSTLSYYHPTDEDLRKAMAFES